MTTVFPPAPSWYCPQITRTSRNGRVAYGSKTSLVILTIRPDSPQEVKDGGHVETQTKECEVEADTGSGPNAEDWRQNSPDKEFISEICPHPFATMQQICGDKAKITCVDWSPDSCLVSVGFDDGLVKVIKVDGWAEETQLTGTQVHSTHKEVSKDRCKVNTLSWSHPKPDQVISGDDFGTIVIWDVTVNATRFLTFGRQSIYVLETHPFNGDIIGFGCRMGLVFVVDVSGGGKLLQKIRAHDEDIQGFSWSPSKEWDVLQFKESKETKEDSLLAVACRDKSITVWSSKTAKKLAHLKLPGRPGRPDLKRDAMKGSWTSCHWLERDVLLSSGPQGELLEWRLDKLKKKSDGTIFFSDGCDAKVLHKEHLRTIYSISKLPDGTVVTTGQDRSVVAFNTKRRSHLFTLPTFASGIFSIVSNPVDPSVLAFGAGDGQIRIWKMSSTKSTFDVSAIWSKLSSSKITALAWHPDKESTLGFGTDEGRVGTLDALNPRSSPRFSEFKHRSTVYTLCWGPPISGSTHKSSGIKVLYSCGDNAVFMHDENLKSSTNVETICDVDKERRVPKRSDVAFEPSLYRFMLLGSDDGSVEVFSMPKFESVCILKSFQKLVQSIAWHPHYIGSSRIPSRLHNWIAVASNEYHIHVWDLTKALQNSSKDVSKISNETEEANGKSVNEQLKNDDVTENSSNTDGVTKQSSNTDDVTPESVKVLTPVHSQPTFVLSGHIQRVIFVTWSPHEDGRLLSVSYDNTAQVWDAEAGQPLANFSGHSNRLFCGLWSPIDSDVIFTGGDDSTVFGWRISSQKNVVPPPKVTKKVAKFLSNKVKEASIPSESFEDLLEERKREILKRQEDQRAEKISDQISQLEGEDCREATVQPDVKFLQAKRRLKKKALFTVSLQHAKSAVSNSYLQCELLQKFCSGDDQAKEAVKPDLDKFPHLGFFTGSSALEKILEEEVTSLRSQELEESAGFLASFSGDYGPAVRQAIQSSKLTDWYIGLAGATSHELWREACQAYANQLFREEEFLKGSTYLLMIGKVLEAIEVLYKNEYHQAAVAIAKSRLPDNASVFKDLYGSWAFHSLKNGQFAHAANCWIAAGDPVQASCALAKQPDPNSLRVAAWLSVQAGDSETGRVLAIQCATKCLERKTWSCLDKLSDQFDVPEVKEMQLHSKELRLHKEVDGNAAEKNGNDEKNEAAAGDAKKIIDKENNENADKENNENADKENNENAEKDKNQNDEKESNQNDEKQNNENDDKENNKIDEKENKQKDEKKSNQNDEKENNENDEKGNKQKDEKESNQNDEKQNNDNDEKQNNENADKENNENDEKESNQNEEKENNDYGKKDKNQDELIPKETK